MSDKPRTIINLSAEHRHGENDPCPIVVRVGTDRVDLGGLNDRVGRLVSRLLRSFTVDWDDFDLAECFAHAVAASGLEGLELDPDFPECHAEDTAIKDMLAAANRFWRARLARVSQESDTTD